MNLAQSNQKEMKKAKVLMYDKAAGILMEETVIADLKNVEEF